MGICGLREVGWVKGGGNWEAMEQQQEQQQQETASIFTPSSKRDLNVSFKFSPPKL